MEVVMYGTAQLTATERYYSLLHRAYICNSNI